MSIHWDPKVNDRLRALHLMAREIVWGMNNGHHRSHRVTRSIEFVDHKEYQPGDLLSAIDWKVFARTDKLMIRRQQADTDVDCILLLDASADMAIGLAGEMQESLENSRLSKAITAVAALALMISRRGDSVGLKICAGTGVSHHFIPPSRQSLPAIFHALATVSAHGKADLASEIGSLTQFLHRKSIVISVSDWMEEPNLWGPSLEMLAAQGHDLRALHLYSRREWSLDFPEDIRLISKEDTRQVPLDSAAMKEHFLNVVAEYLEEVHDWAGRGKMIWVEAALEDSLIQPLVQLLRKR